MTDSPQWHRPDPGRDPNQPPEFSSNMPPPPPASAGSKPGVIPLRPLGLSEILDGAITTMRRFPALMIGLAVAVVALTQLVELPLVWILADATGDVTTPTITEDEVASAFGTLLAITLLALVINLLAAVVLTGTFTIVVGRAVLGRPATFAEVWAEVKPKILRLLGVSLVYPLAAIAIFLPVFVLVAVVPPLGGLVGIAAFFVVIWLLVLFALASPALVLEDTRVFAAFGRSRELVKGAWWRCFGILLLSFLIVFAISFIVSIPFELLGGGATLGDDLSTVSFSGLVLSSIGSIVAAAITYPFFTGVIVLLYTDQRMRREGLDIELARQVGQ